MKNKIVLLSFLAFQLLPLQFAGQILYTGKDSVLIDKDTTIRLTIPRHRGNVQWQKSPDGIFWSDFTGETKDTIFADKHTEAVYRARITEGTCMPVISDSAYLFIGDSVSRNRLHPSDPGLILISDSLQLANGEYVYMGLEKNDVQAGKVIIDELTGRLRKVTGVTQKGDTVFTTTEPATMEDLFFDISFRLSTSMINQEKNLKPATLPEMEKALTDEQGFIHPVDVIFYSNKGVPIKSASVLTFPDREQAGALYMHKEWSGFDLYKLSGNFSLPDRLGKTVQYTGNVRSTISEGYITFDPDFKFEFEFTRPSVKWHNLKANKGEISRFKFYCDQSLLDVRNILALESDISYECLKEWNLVPGAINVRFKFIVAQTPLWIDIKTDVVCGLSLASIDKLSASQGFQSNDSVTVGAGYETKNWSMIKKIKKGEHTFSSGSGTGNADLKFEIYPSVEMKLYDILGPKLRVGPDLAFESLLSSSGNWNKNADLGVNATVQAEVAAIGKGMIPLPATEWNFLNENIWKAPVNLTVVSGNNQTGPSGTVLPLPVILKVTDSGGLPLQNVQVHFSAITGSVASPVVKTDANGIAQALWTLSGTPGEQSLKAFLLNGKDQEIAGGSLVIKATVVSTNLPVVTTAAVTSITQTTATCGGNVTSDGGAMVTARGVCWGTTSTPTVNDSKTTDGTGTGTYVSNMAGMNPATTYYVRAYATNSQGTAYGSQVSFTTQMVLYVPTVTTAAVTNITQTTATCGGNVTSDGNAAVTARGVCWSTTSTPTTSDSKTTDGTGTGTYVSNMAGMNPATTYYVRAYATNSQGTAYGNQVSFTTQMVLNVPTVTTAAVTNVTQTTATCGGNVTSDGNAAVTARGVCWNTSENPTTANSKTSDGNGTGNFTSSLTGLTACTVYYIRAYATNSQGTAYGNQVSFTSSGTGSVPTLTTAAVSVFNFTNATCGGTISGDGGATVTARGVCYNTTGSPVITDGKTVDGSGSGTFTSTVTGLNYGTLYHIRAYATNCAGTAYGDEKTFHTWNEVGPFTDPRDGHQYLWVRIKNQYWQHENLAWLPNVSPSTVGSDTVSAHYYVYGYEGTDVSAAKATSNYATYGVLYNWLAAQNACPAGWHLPGDEEWKTLEMNLGMTQVDADKEGWRESGAVGRSLKAATGWADNGNGWNTSGFKAFPAGYRAYWGEFTYLTTMALFWTPKQNIIEKDRAMFRGLHSGNSGVNRSYSYKSGGLSVRCLKD